MRNGFSFSFLPESRLHYCSSLLTPSHIPLLFLAVRTSARLQGCHLLPASSAARSVAASRDTLRPTRVLLSTYFLSCAHRRPWSSLINVSLQTRHCTPKSLLSLPTHCRRSNLADPRPISCSQADRPIRQPCLCICPGAGSSTVSCADRRLASSPRSQLHAVATPISFYSAPHPSASSPDPHQQDGRVAPSDTLESQARACSGSTCAFGG